MQRNGFVTERVIEILKLVDRWIGIPLLCILASFRRLLSALLPARSVTVKTIVMVKLWGVGNLAMIFPLIRAVKRTHPRTRIVFLTTESNAGLLRSLPLLDDVLVLRTRSLGTIIWSLGLAAFKLRRLKPDLYLDFEQFLRISASLGVISGARQMVGLETPGQARGWIYHVKVPYRKDRHMTRTFSDVVRSAGIDTTECPSLEVPRSDEAARSVERFLDRLPDRTSPLVALHLGSGDNFPARRWPVAHFARVAESIHQRFGACIVLTGIEAEQHLADEFAAQCRVPFVSSMGEFNLLEFVEFLARVDLLITNDTAPAHIGSALDRPLIAIYGPNSPDLYGPINEKARVFYSRLPCSPCITNLNAKTSRCRIPSCITNIRHGAVAAAAGDLLRPLERGEAARRAVSS